MKQSPKSQTYLEVCVLFKETDNHDFVASRASNLGEFVHQDGRPKAGIRIDVPHFLLTVFKDLNSYAFNVRRSHGKKAKTHIKFDDPNSSLLLEIRLPNSENWLKISPVKARELTCEANAEELTRLQRDMRSRTYRGSESETTWGDSVNSMPLGSRTRNTTWQPPEREISRMEFGGAR